MEQNVHRLVILAVHIIVTNEFKDKFQTYSKELAGLKAQKPGEQQEIYESCIEDMTAVSQALAGIFDMSEIKLKSFCNKVGITMGRKAGQNVSYCIKISFPKTFRKSNFSDEYSSGRAVTIA